MKFNSTLRVVSDGSLTSVALTFDLREQDEVHVYFNDGRIETGFSVDLQSTPQKVLFNPAVPAGVTVTIRRYSDMRAIPHVFHLKGGVLGGAEFNSLNVDENFDHILRASQDAMDSFELAGISVEGAVLAAARAEAAAEDAEQSYKNTLAYDQQGEQWMLEAQAAAIEAEDSKDLAYRWANAPENQPVEQGEFSAYHWAEKAKNLAVGVDTLRQELANPSMGADMVAYKNGSVASKLDEIVSGAVTEPLVDAKVTSHNEDVDSHPDLRTRIVAEVSSHVTNEADRAESAADLAGILSGTHRAFANKSLMDADLSATPGKVAVVLNDPDVSKNGWYFKVGLSGEGSWARMPNQPALDSQLNFITEAPNWNNLTTSGKYRSPLNGKSVGQPPVDENNMVVDHEEGVSGRAWQTAKTLAGVNPRQWIRKRYLGDWSDWRELITYKDGEPNKVHASQLGQRDFSNIYPDPDLSDPTMLEGDFSLTEPSFGSAQKNRISKNVILLPATTGAIEFPLSVFPVESGRPYYISVTTGRSTGVGPVATSVGVKWFADWDATQEIAEVDIGHTITSSAPETRSEIVLAPQMAVRAKLVVRKQESNNPISVAIYDIIVRRAVTNDLVYQPKYTPPTTTASSVVCLYSEDGSFLYEKDPQKQIAPASLTKILTAYTALKIAKEKNIGVGQVMEMVEDDIVGGSGNNLNAGDKITFYDALVNMFLPSSNSAAMMVARFFGSYLDSDNDPVSAFVDNMNQVATNIGMTHSMFKNPTGLGSPGQTTTASDMALLMNTVSNNKTITEIWGLYEYTIETKGETQREIHVTHTVPLVMSKDVIGAKSGTITPNDYHVALYVKAPGGNHIVIIIMQSSSGENRYIDAENVVRAFVDGYDWPVLKPTPRT